MHQYIQATKFAGGLLNGGRTSLCLSEIPREQHALAAELLDRMASCLGLGAQITCHERDVGAPTREFDGDGGADAHRATRD
jgi:hypothetical protein